MENQFTEQMSLNQIVINKVYNKIESNRFLVQKALERIHEEHASARDYILPLGNKYNMNNPTVLFDKEGNVLKMKLQNEEFKLHPHALSQVAKRLDITVPYIKDLAAGQDWEVNLAKTILTEHNNNKPKTKVLIRTVGNEVRGVLSDHYKRFNSLTILLGFIQSTTKNGGQIMSLTVTDTKLYCETILPQPIEIPTAKNGLVTVFIGARFSTSDYGDGAIEMRTFLLNGACLNGMVRESVMRQVHLGSKLGDNLMLSDRTYRLDTQTTASAISDLTSSLFDKETIMKRAVEIQEASNVNVDLTSELRTLVRGGQISKSEEEKVNKILLNNNPNDGVTGEATLWKLTQAITAHARELDPRRERDLHEISGALLNRLKIN